MRAFSTPAGGYYEIDIQPGDPIPAWLLAQNATETTVKPAYVAPLSIRAAVPLSHSDVTFIRVAEAVAAGRTTWVAADVAAFLNYRKALRDIVTGKDTTSTTLPALPPLPVNV